MINTINSGAVDFVLTIPIINFATVKVQYGKDHSSEHWEILKETVHQICPDYDKDFELVENGYIYYGYNMFIAKREALNEYCEWLFPILFSCERKIGVLGDKYQNRYIGFMAERLLTVFLCHNRDKYAMAEGIKHFIGIDCKNYGMQNKKSGKIEYAIYGAQGIALGVYKSIKALFPNKNICCFLVTEIGKNALSIGGIPVKELDKLALECSRSEKDNMQILIATPENVMGEIEKNLEAYGFCNYVRLDSKRWAQMQKNAFISKNIFAPLEIYPIGFHAASLHIYKARFYKDKNLKTKYLQPYYITDIQVGAARTDIRLADVLDNSGDNISDKNGNYSELTGLYWIWKNRIRNGYYGYDCYYGLAHYRRLLELSDDDLLRLEDNQIDVILPYPMPYEPDIEEHHRRYLSDEEWIAVQQALDELQPEYAKAFKKILKQEYLYNYNIIIARSQVLDAYCGWLFPILFRIEEIHTLQSGKAPNRFIGYVGETLETLYFIHNKERLRIAHTGCRFLT